MEVDHETRNSRNSLCAGWLWFWTMLCTFLWECWWRIVTWRAASTTLCSDWRLWPWCSQSETYRWCSCAKMPHFLSLLEKHSRWWRLWGVGVPTMCTQWNMKLLTLLTSTKPVWTEEGFHPSAVFCSSFVLQIVSATHTCAHTHLYTHATRWCRCSEGKDAPKYFRNRLAAERNMKLMKGTVERQSRKGPLVSWKELGLFDDEW